MIMDVTIWFDISHTHVVLPPDATTKYHTFFNTLYQIPSRLNVLKVTFTMTFGARSSFVYKNTRWCHMLVIYCDNNLWIMDNIIRDYFIMNYCCISISWIFLYIQGIFGFKLLLHSIYVDNGSIHYNYYKFYNHECTK